MDARMNVYRVYPLCRAVGCATYTILSLPHVSNSAFWHSHSRNRFCRPASSTEKICGLWPTPSVNGSRIVMEITDILIYWIFTFVCISAHTRALLRPQNECVGRNVRCGNITRVRPVFILFILAVFHICIRGVFFLHFCYSSPVYSFSKLTFP